MDEYALNPAGRLYLFLEHMNTSGAAGESLLPQIARYVGAEPWTVSFYSALALLAAQPGLLEEAIAAMPADSAPVDESQEQMPRIVAAIDAAGNPGVDLQGFRRQYDQGTLMFLRMTSRTLNRARLGEGDVSASIDAIRAAAEDLRKRIVDDTEIDATVRRLLFELVDQILRALDLIKIGGVDVVLAEFDRFTGRYVREPWLQRTIRQHPKVFSTLTQLATAVNAIASLINAGAALDNTLDSLFTSEPYPALAPAPGHDADTA